MMAGSARLRPWLAAALLPLAAGCSSFSTSSMNPMNWFSSASTIKPTVLTEIKPTLTMTRVWNASVGKSDVYVFTPVQSGGMVYAAAADGTLAAFDAQSGKQKWRVVANKQGLSAGVGADDGVIAVGTAKGEVLAFDEAGLPKWRAEVSSEILGTPLVSDSMVVVRSNDNRIFGFSAADGKRQWVYQRTAPALVLRNFGSMTAAGGLVFAGFPGGKLVALTISGGTVRWEATVALPKGATELERIADISSAPVLNARDVCAVAFQGRAVCFDGASGQPLWTRDISSAAGLAADSSYVFVSDEKSAVVALARQTGSSLWKQEKLLYRTISAPLSVGRAVIVGDYQGILHALSREDGSFIGRQATDGSGIAAPPQLVEIAGKEAFLVQTRKGGLYVFTI
jgi:outer membrane protein assembly factor BamB